ncbi:hypothetical protein [Escherichia fergusonii]|nr:hypothetical protein [Escherichia fergusonii]
MKKVTVTCLLRRNSHPDATAIGEEHLAGITGSEHRTGSIMPTGEELS